MKKTGLIIQVVLALAIVVLYVLHFTGKSSNNSSLGASKDTANFKLATGSIAYVDIDTVVAKYNLTKDLSKDLEEKGKKFDTELTQKQKLWQNNVQDFQYKAQRGLEVSAKLAEMQKQLQDDQQKLINLRDTYGAQMQEENAVMMRKVLSSITEFLKIYNQEKHYSFVFGHTFDGKILFADKGLDITQDVLKGLNDKYKTDSTKK
jgi:outer membrane protein